jgi:hypothetical protein
MIYKKYGPCTHEECGKWTEQVRDFPVSVNLFHPESKSISPEVKEALLAWRDEPIKCEVHNEPKGM